MNTLEPPDSHHLNAAHGWLELGDATSAGEELGRISTAQQLHPAVLEVRWEISARQNEWKDAHTIAQMALDLTPHLPGPWIQRSYALHELKLTEDAYESLLPAADRFPQDATIAYNLACYCCQLGQHKLALEWFVRARAAGDPKHLNAMAMKDPDLAPLRSEITQL